MTDKRISEQHHATFDSIRQQDYAIFQNHGYRGLYDGLTFKDIHARKFPITWAVPNWKPICFAPHKPKES